MSTATIAHDSVAFFADRYPDRVALADADSGASFSWRHLDNRVGRLATVFTTELGPRRGGPLPRLPPGAGRGPGPRVGRRPDPHPLVFELQFACFRAGLVFTPLNWRLAAPELSYMCSDAGASVIVHDDAWRDLGVETAAAAGIPHCVSTTSLDATAATAAPMAPT